MTANEDLLSELIETKFSIQNNSYNLDQVNRCLKKNNSLLLSRTRNDSEVKSNILKSFFVTFNISNFSDLTVLFLNSSDNVSIMEYAGSEVLFNEFKSLIDIQEKFYKDIDNISVKGENFKVFHESMENAKGVYTVITFTESDFFKPTKYHMLCDIVMDIIRSADMSNNSVFDDLFEDTAVGINSFIADNRDTDNQLYFFKFNNIYDLFVKMGLEIIIELSDGIKKKLTEFFGDKSAIFRFSLLEYIVILTEPYYVNGKTPDFNDPGILSFNYKGMILNHHCSKIPYNKNRSVYDLFEAINLKKQ